MFSRRQLLALSIAATLALYAALLVAAPHIRMLHPGARAERAVERLNVYLRDPATLLQPDTQADRQAFSARPGSVRDLLAMEETSIDDTAFTRPEATLPDLARRVARDAIQAEAAPMEESLRRLEARVLEINREAARRDLEVPRRLVRPSDTALPGAGQFPDLTAPLAEETPVHRALPPSGLPSLLARGPALLEPGEPEWARPLVEIEPPRPLPEMEPALEAVREPVRQAMEAARAERPYAFLDGLLDIELATWRNPGEAEGYFELVITPKKGADIPVLPKDVAFVVDASNSIPQHKLNVTLKGVRAALRQLRDDDQFNVVIFRDAPEPFQPQPVAATPDNLRAAERFLSDLKSSGQTDVYKAVQPMVQQARRAGCPGIVLVVSDGRPTTGLQDSRAIINGLTADNRAGNGVYAFGGGKTVNRYLLDLLAYRNKGVARVAPTIEGIEKALPDFFSTLRDPILVDLGADFGRIDATTVFPQALPDFFQGQAVTLYGRYNPESKEPFAFRIAGRSGADRKEVIFRATFEDARAGTREIATGWAFQKAYYLIGRISREGETPELLAELKRLRTEYGVRTSYDS